MIKLVIFDLDGTLLDTRTDIANACNHALTMCGCPVRELEEYNMLVGRGIYNLFRKALPPKNRTDEMVTEMKKHFVSYYEEHMNDFTRPYPGIIGLLDMLTEAGVSLAVASNKYQSGTEALTEKHFGRNRFKKILGQIDGRPIKPDPGIVFEAMKAVPGISREEVIYCGDSDVDMETGANAGVKTIGVTWGFRTFEELKGCNPWRIVENPLEIYNAATCYSE